MTDYLAAIAGGSRRRPRWERSSPVPNGAEPGSSASVTTDLQPGHYLVLCLMPGPDGIPHVVKGMSTELDVTGNAKPAPAPTGIPVVHLREFEFGVPKRFTEAVAAGTPIEAANDGQQAHEETWRRACSTASRSPTSSSGSNDESSARPHHHCSRRPTWPARRCSLRVRAHDSPSTWTPAR